MPCRRVRSSDALLYAAVMNLTENDCYDDDNDAHQFWMMRTEEIDPSVNTSWYKLHRKNPSVNQTQLSPQPPTFCLNFFLHEIKAHGQEGEANHDIQIA